MTVHLFGAASSPGCANFGLKYLARQHSAEFPVASSFLENHLYVDDGLISFTNVKDAIDMIGSSVAEEVYVYTSFSQIVRRF